MIEPTERLLWLIVAAGVVGVCGFVAPAIGGAAPFVLAGIALCVVVDALLAGSPSLVRVRRELSDRAVEGKDIDVTLVIECKGSSRPVVVEVTDSVASLQPMWSTVHAVCGPDDVVRVVTRRRCVRRSDDSLGRFAVRTRGPLGLVQRRQRRDGAGDAVAVGIDIAAIARAAERLVRGNDSEGARRKRAIERGRELDSLREYRRGDDVRLVDWKATARRGELVVKELVPETRQDVLVVLDTGRQFLGGARVDGAVHAALLLSAAVIEKGDRAGLAIVDDDVRAFVPPREGRAQLGRLAEKAQAVQAQATEPAYQELSALVSTRQKRRALVAVITDVVDEAQARAVARAVSTLRGKHLVMVVCIADPSVAAFASDTTAHTTVRNAAATLVGHRRRAQKALEASGAIIVDTVPDRAGADAASAYLSLKGAGRL